MSNYSVGFEITADVTQAVDAANKLIKEMTKAAEKADFGKTEIAGLPGTLEEASKNAQQAQKSFSTFAIEVNKVAKAQEELNKLNRQHSAQKGVKTRAERDMEDALARQEQYKGGKSKSARANYTQAVKDYDDAKTRAENADKAMAKLDADAEKIIAQATKAGERINDMATSAKTVLSTYGGWSEEVSKINSGVEGTAARQKDLATAIKETNTDFEEQEKAAKKAGDAFEKETARKSSTQAERIKEAEEELKGLSGLIDKILADNFGGPEKFTFTDFTKAKQDLTALKDIIAELHVPDEFAEDYNRIILALDKIARGERMLKKEAADAEKNPILPTQKIEDEAAAAEQQIYELAQRTSKVLSQMMDPNTFTLGDLKRREEELKSLKKAIEDIHVPKELDAEYQRLSEELLVVRAEISKFNKEVTSNDAPEEEVESLSSLITTLDSLNKEYLELRNSGQSVDEVMQQIADTTQKIDDRLAFDSSKQSVYELTRYVKDLGDGLRTLTNLNEPAGLDNMFTRITRDYEKAKRVLSGSKEELKTAFDITEATHKQDAELQKVINTLDAVEQKMQMTSGRAALSDLLQRLAELEAARKTLKDYGFPVAMESQLVRITSLITQTKNEINEYRKSSQAASKASTEMGSSGEKASKKVEQASRKMGKSFRGIGPSIKVVKDGFNSLHKSSDKIKKSFDSMARTMRSRLKHLITGITKYVLGFRSLFFLVRRLRKYVGEGIKNLAQFNDGNNLVNESITDMLSSLLFLKNAWAAAFSPIITFVRPILVSLIDRLAEVGNAVARFLSFLLGQEIAFNAVRVQAEDYAGALDAVGGSAGGASDKVKKLTDRLAAFDDLNVLGVDSDPNNGGSGGSGGSADAYKPDPNEMFTIVDPEKNGILQMLKDAWAKADFSEIGAQISNKIKEALQIINWSDLQSTAFKVGESFASFLNGVLGDPNLFTTIGNTLAQGLNTAIQGLSGFFKTYKPGSLATDISAFFKGLFGGKDEEGNPITGENGDILGIDWTTLGSTISSGISTALNEAATLLNTFPTDGLVSGISDLLKAIDWSTVFANLLIFLGSTFDFGAGLLNALAEQINNIDVSELDLTDLAEGFWNLLATVIVGSAKVTIAATNFAMALFSKILEAMVSLEKSEDDDWNTFWEGAFNEVGDNIILGLFNGISHALEGFAEWAAEHIGKPIVTWFEDAFDMHSPSKVSEQWGEWIIQGLLNGFTNFIADIKTKWNEIKIAIQNKVGEIKTKVSEAWQSMRETATEKFILMRTSIVNIFNQLKEAVKSPINGFLGIIESMVNKVIGGVNKVIDALNLLPDIKFTNPFTGTEYALGFSIPKLSEVTIPRLAQGAVIPPNREFMAVLGDQSHGTNIEAPLDTIKQAVAEVLANNNNQEVIDLLQQLITVVEHKNLTIGDKEIGKATARYNTQQMRLRGTSF